MTKPIYDAPIEERLRNILSACQMALECFNDEILRDSTPGELAAEGLEADEMAVCDWIIRPRFKKREP